MTTTKFWNQNVNLIGEKKNIDVNVHDNDDEIWTDKIFLIYHHFVVVVVNQEIIN